MITWSDDLQCLVDEMGLPISRSAAAEWLTAIGMHLRIDPAVLSEKAKKVMLKKFPHLMGDDVTAVARYE